LLESGTYFWVLIMMVADVIKMLIEILTRIVALWSTFGPEGPHDLDRRVKGFFQRPLLRRAIPT
jgi:hypothetical protein